MRLTPVFLVVLFVGAIAASQSAEPNLAESSARATQDKDSSAIAGEKRKHHSVDLKWTASKTKGIAGYYVYRMEEDGNGKYERVTPKPIEAVTYTDSTVESGKTYSYAVSAVQEISGKMVESNRISVLKVRIPDP